MKVAIICRNDIRQRFANILSLLKNIEALEEYGSKPILVIPKNGWTIKNAYCYLQEACSFFGVGGLPSLTLIPSTKNYFGRSFGILASISCVFKKIDLLWSRDIYGAYMSVMLGVRTIFEHHTQLSTKSQRLISKIQHNHNFRGIIAISQAHKDLLISYGIRNDKILVAHSGIDRWILNLGDKSPINNERKKIVYAGSFYEGRGIESIFEIADRCSDYDFMCIGGSLKQIEYYKKLSSHLPNVQLLPKLSRPNLLPYLQEADVLIAPYTQNSRSISGDNIAQYQSPLKLMEYMALGKPILTTRVGAIPEIITDRYNGILVEPDEIESYVKAINQLVEDEKFAKELGDNALHEAKKYTWNQRVSNILDFAMK